MWKLHLLLVKNLIKHEFTTTLVKNRIKKLNSDEAKKSTGQYNEKNIKNKPIKNEGKNQILTKLSNTQKEPIERAKQHRITLLEYLKILPKVAWPRLFIFIFLKQRPQLYFYFNKKNQDYYYLAYVVDIK